MAEEAGCHPVNRQRAVSNPACRRSYESKAALCGGECLTGRNDALRSPRGAMGFIPGWIFPRWSPDEKQILAMEVNTGKLRISDAAGGEWRTLTDYGVGYPRWSRDGKYIYGVLGSFSVIEAIRIEVATGGRQEIARTDFKP